MGHRITAADVARHAKVSTATVSLIVNGKSDGRVAPRTRERVMAAVRELGYKVDSVARSLATGRRHSVALIVPDIANPYFSLLTQGVAERLGPEYQLCLIIADPAHESFAASLEQVVAERVDGVLAEAPAADQVEDLDLSCPIVVLDRPSPRTSRPYVGFDLPAGAAALATHLTGLGHETIAYLDADIGGPTFDVRRARFIARLRATTGHGLVRPGASARTGIEVAAAAFAEVWPRWEAAGVTAVVCAADILAYGVLAEAARRGLSVPGDLSVAAFDDLPFSAIVGPGLTTVALPGLDLGHHAAGLLLDLMEGADEDEPTPIPATLRVRGSTGPARRR